MGLLYLRFWREPMQIALLEDDKVLHQTIKEILEHEGHIVASFFDGESLLQAPQKFDLYILDISVPKSSGLEVLEVLDAKAIIISAYYELHNITQAYKFGALDFLRKPFFIEELLLKINQLFPKKIAIDDMIYMPQAATLQKGDTTIHLSSRENALLELLVRNPNRNITYLEIALRVYSDKEFVSDNAIYSLVKRLKQKTGLNIVSVPKIGYRINL